MTIKSFRDLFVWQKSMGLVTEIYRLTKSFPKEELYGLTSQVRKCTVSIPSNIAEGYGRGSTKEYIRFLQIARGSLYELQTQLEIAVNLNYLENMNFEDQFHVIDEIERMMNSLIKKLSDKSLNSKE